MGMGAPLANPNIFDAIRLLTDSKYFRLSQRKITLSTVGIVPQIRRITADFPQINIAFSLHTPFQSQRSELMPINNKYPLHEVMLALENHITKTSRKVFIAYIMIENINDSISHAQAVAKLLKKSPNNAHLFHVDLIPYNMATATPVFKSSKKSQIERFSAFLKSQGISVTIRAQFGSDLKAGCGQLCADS